ncbi:hypothetical protein B0H16DRAFT_1459752 [Mycena metata]|uniref:Uncharacterized protein n=1 Tax=Mycena metata TaxID=1033252 RepID=A0AAD7NAW1_9AGAR|nr:hypothetical protein B0H16DRAFT_1459752 [Mycena metata]
MTRAWKGSTAKAALSPELNALLPREAQTTQTLHQQRQERLVEIIYIGPVILRPFNFQHCTVNSVFALKAFIRVLKNLKAFRRVKASPEGQGERPSLIFPRASRADGAQPSTQSGTNKCPLDVLLPSELEAFSNSAGNSEGLHKARLKAFGVGRPSPFGRTLSRIPAPPKGYLKGTVHEVRNGIMRKSSGNLKFPGCRPKFACRHVGRVELAVMPDAACDR